MLSTITHTGYDADLVGTTLPETTFEYSASTLSWTESTTYSIPQCFAENEGYDCGTRLAQVDGDALPDLLFSDHNIEFTDPTVYINDGDGTGWTEDSGISLPVYFIDGTDAWGGSGVVAMDVDGDLLEDFVHGQADGPYDGDTDDDRDAYINNGSTGWRSNRLHCSVNFTNSDYSTRKTGSPCGRRMRRILDLVETASRKAFDNVYINRG